MKNVVLADLQDITRYAIHRMAEDMGAAQIKKALNVNAVKEELGMNSKDTVVVLDYSLLNTTEEEVLLMHLRYPDAHFLFFSEQLSRDFLRRLCLGNNRFSVVLKNSPLCEISEALETVFKGRQYICSDAQSIINTPEEKDDRSPLTKTEKDILRLMAMGKKSKDIAEERFLSVYTVMTHRKNIFRKLGVNNAQEAVRFALRAGIVDPLEYYI